MSKKIIWQKNSVSVEINLSTSYISQGCIAETKKSKIDYLVEQVNTK